MRVLVTGAAGSGTSTLAAALSAQWGAAHVEADDFLWLPTTPPYTTQRPVSERAAMIERALHAHSAVVIAGSVVGWGIERWLDAVVFLHVDAAVRLQRLRAREQARFGQANEDFLRWAAQYDEGRLDGRSLATHESWLGGLKCRVIRLVGEMTLQGQLARIGEEMAAQRIRVIHTT